MALLVRNVIFLNRPHFLKPYFRLCSLHCGNYQPICKTYSNVDCSRMLSSLQKTPLKAAISEAESSAFTSKEYRMFYKFPHIKSASLINRLKKIYTFLVIAGAPVMTALFAADVVTDGTLGVFFSLGGLVCLSLYTLGIAFYKLIGFAYLSTDNSIVKVSYLDFWGKRVDSYCPVQDIIPLSDLQENTSDLYIKFMQYSKPQILYLTVRFGQITDKECFVKVFGKIEE